jgi:hypothetical protein
MRCQIEIVFSPPRADLDSIPGMRADAGGFVYRVRNAEGRLHISGSARTLDPFAALSRARHAAAQAGYAYWRAWNAGGPYSALES